MRSQPVTAHLIAPLLATVALAFAAPAWSQHSDKEIQEDIKRHRAMAQAHEGMAKCLEQGKGEKVCTEQLQQACKGLALGKSCGMRHAH
ncbi:MAG: hypothetical protein RJA09_44 [Pseudomonadota bacterium]